MKHLHRAWKRLAGALSAARREAELSAEIESHLEMQTEDNLKLGIPPEEARRRAVLKFGAVESVKESYRDQRGLPRVETFARDVRYGFRAMRRDPGFAAVAVLSLALGIGATTAIFSAVNALLIRPLPYPEPERLVTVSLGGAITAPAFELIRRESQTIERAALFVNRSFNLGGSGEPERVPGARVSADLFRVLGVQPALGRTFTTDEDAEGHNGVVVLGHALWRRRFGADPNIVGRKILLTGVPCTVIGVMPPGFRFPDGPELPVWAGAFPPAEMWRPMALAAWERTCEGCFNFAAIARLRPGVSPSDARGEMSAILTRALPPGRRSAASELTVRSLKDAVAGKVRPAVAILFGAVALALLIACVNMANLLLARGLQRRTEIAVRLSLGAGRGRIVRQLLTEALVIALAAAALAVPIAIGGVRALIAIAPPGTPRLDTVALDTTALGFTFVLALATALVFGCVPAFATARRDPGDVMKGGSRSVAGARSRLRPALVVAESALCLVLLIGSALLARSFVTVARVPLGFHPENLLTMRVPLDGPQYDDRRVTLLAARLSETCAALPGVISAAAVNTLPLTNEGEGHGLIAEDSPDPNRWVMLRYRAVTPSYFRTLGIRLLRGREFTGTDSGNAPVAIVSETGARQLWPGVSDPVGRRIREGKIPTVVIGVVEDTHASGLDAEIRPYIYVPFTQFTPGELALAVRTASDPAGIAAAVKREVWQIDRNLPVTHIATMRQLVADSVAPRRFQAVLMAVFAGFALVLAAIGIYGVASYSVTQRTHEIGIRMALGASRAGVLSRVMREAGLLALAGAILGLSAAFVLTPLLRSLLYGVSAGEPVVFAACAALLIGVAAAASLIPALRAAWVDPMSSLRHE